MTSKTAATRLSRQYLSVPHNSNPTFPPRFKCREGAPDVYEDRISAVASRASWDGVRGAFGDLRSSHSDPGILMALVGVLDMLCVDPPTRALGLNQRRTSVEAVHGAPTVALPRQVIAKILPLRLRHRKSLV